MGCLFKKLFVSKNEKSKSFRTAVAKKLDGRTIKYVSERIISDKTGEAEDTVIGRAGALILKGNELIVYSEEKVLFRADVSELDASELLSLEGVILTAPDIEHDRRSRTVIAYYTYYRK